MANLIRLMSYKRTIEIGTFTGWHSSSCFGSTRRWNNYGACDISERWTAIGKKKWEQAGVANKIDLRIGPAIETLDELIAKERRPLLTLRS